MYDICPNNFSSSYNISSFALKLGYCTVFFTYEPSQFECIVIDTFNIPNLILKSSEQTLLSVHFLRIYNTTNTFWIWCCHPTALVLRLTHRTSLALRSGCVLTWHPAFDEQSLFGLPSAGLTCTWGSMPICLPFWQLGVVSSILGIGKGKHNVG